MESLTENNLNGNNSINGISQEHKKLANEFNLFQKEVMMELLLVHYFFQVVTYTMFVKSKFHLEKCRTFWDCNIYHFFAMLLQGDKDTYASTFVVLGLVFRVLRYYHII
jgi:hypothetical protein